MASRHIHSDGSTSFGSNNSKPELSSPIRSKSISVPSSASLKKTRLGMYRDNADDIVEDETVGSQVYGAYNSSTMLFGGPNEKDLNSMYPASQAATSGYYGLGAAFSGNGSMSSSSTHSSVGSSSTGNIGSRGTQFAGNRGAHTGTNTSTPGNSLSTQNSVSNLPLSGSSALAGRNSILSPSSNGMGQQQSQFNFASSGAQGSMSMSNPKFSRSLSATASSQAATSGSFSAQMRMTRNTASSGFEGRSYMSQQSQPTGIDTQPLDLSDFPVVGRSNGRRTQSQAASTPGLSSGTSQLPTRNYGIVSKPREQEFTMVSEDFPALPSSGNFKSGMSDAGDSGKLSQSLFPMSMSSSSGLGSMSLSSNVGSDSFRITGSIPVDSSHQESHTRSSNVGVIGQRPVKGSYQHTEQSNQSASSSLSSRQGIQTTSDGVITNIPSGMVKDQFGLIGLLTFIRVAENEPNLVSLALGSDLTTLGLNLQSPDTLCSSFTSPFSEGPTRPQDIDFSVPEEYNTNTAIRDKLAPIKLHRYGEDLLFYLYYHSSGDLLQLAAAAELYQRDWRYHKEQKVWLTRAAGITEAPMAVKNNMFETGRYYVFDVTTWRKVIHDMHIEYDQLEDTPHLPKSYQLQQQHQGSSHHSNLAQLL